MSFSPYSAMITVCVCFNSRVQLTVPSFTAWLGSRYSKALFIVLRWPAQGKDKGACQGCHHVKRWACRAAGPQQPRLQPPPLPRPPPPPPRRPAAGPARPHLARPPREAALHARRPLHRFPGLRSEGPELQFCFCDWLVQCGLGFGLLIWKMAVLKPSSRNSGTAGLSEMRLNVSPGDFIQVTLWPALHPRTPHSEAAGRRGPVRRCLGMRALC